MHPIKGRELPVSFSDVELFYFVLFCLLRNRGLKKKNKNNHNLLYGWTARIADCESLKTGDLSQHITTPRLLSTAVSLPRQKRSLSKL